MSLPHGFAIFLVCSLFAVAVPAFADVSVIATVDQRNVVFGDSLTYSITVKDASGALSPSMPTVDGLRFEGPSEQSIDFDFNGVKSHQVIFAWRVTPERIGKFTIPAVEVTVAGKSYRTEPIPITVEKGASAPDLSRTLFGQTQFDVKRLYSGQVAPVDLLLFARQDLPLKGFGGFQYETQGLDFKYVDRAQQSTRVINGETFNVFRIQGAITAKNDGHQRFGPCVIKVRIATGRNVGFFGEMELRETPVTIDEIPIEVLPLPAEGKPANFGGAVGLWNLNVTAKPSEVAVGDPITLTVKISGDGNIDTVPPLKLEGLEDFKTYDPTTKTTKNELGTQGERVVQQVLIAKDTNAKQLPEVSLAYFDPVAKQYKTARQGPFKLVVKTGTGGQTTVVSGSPKARQKEKLGQDIVYLKGDLGPAVAMPFCTRPAFWALNFAPVISLAGLMVWKRRADKLRSDIAYARRSRAAKRARKLLASAASYDHIQRALQNYLGDRLNIPASGITAAIVDEHLVPRGVDGELAAEMKKCFETCDTARFAGATAGETDVRGLSEKVEELIDELEQKNF